MRELIVVCSLLSIAGCVTTKAYNTKIAELDQLRASDAKSAEARAAELTRDIATLRAQLTDTEARLHAAQDERDQLRKQLDDATALTGELKKRLEKLGQNVDKLAGEKGALAKTLDDAKTRLEELRKQKAAAEARAATFRGLVAKLRSMIDSGQLKVVIRDGRMLIQLPNDVLFDSGKTNIKAEGQAALAKVAQVLSTIGDRKFLVAGDTDNVPIHTSRFASNWELSTARAVEVTKFLVQSGVRPDVLAAAGYGEWDPVARNDTTEHRAQNRRIEIVLQPNLSDLPPMDDLMKTQVMTP
jgi:chemotaxis protein MotB